MQKYHLIDIGEVSPATLTYLKYGRITAPVLGNGTVIFENHQFTLDSDQPPDPGEKVMIWCEHEYFCCRVSDYESTYHH
jgi:hypothetical protein